MFINKKGMILQDALLSVLITAVIASCAVSGVIMHVKVHESIEEETGALNEEIQKVYAGLPECICAEETEPDQY